MMRRGTCAATLLIGLSLQVAVQPTAQADVGGGFANWQYSAGVLLDQPAAGEKRPDWSFALGAGADFSPRYAGAAGHQAQGYPLGEIRYRDVAYASVSEGMGWNLLHGADYRAGIALNWDFGRPSGRIAQTQGVDPLPSEAIADLYAEQSLLTVGVPVVLRADVRHALYRDGGFRASLGAYVPVPIGASVVLFAGPSVTVADGTAIRQSYGVSAADASRSGFPAYGTHAGLESAGFGVNAVWFIDDHWTAELLAAWQQSLGSAANSPLTRKAGGGSIGIALGYSW